ncbi:MAG: NFACT RNA binding domain-containing protein [Eubacteriales bacterium]|nr:NFACT RNA binding domain-containing protein [Eubacteriales bacterium]MDD3882737.1 NFACT RNA binding domain-containing protein [Eubacteriales bacterium]MDD4512642.1 NFACT RNA binding domain-containing protein [Eubacteriales bacterium]
MPLDGLTLGFVIHSLDKELAGARIDKVTQPENDALVLLCRAGSKNLKLLLCADPSQARLHITDESYLNPASPPMFCMLMRKRLSGGRIISVTQMGNDRAAIIEIEALDELGEKKRLRLVLEIMGRCSNLICIDESDKIIDCLRHVTGDMNRVREVLPGLKYQCPPPQDKLSFAEADASALLGKLESQSGRLDKAILSAIQGISPIAARELSMRVTGMENAQTADLDLSVASKKLAALLEGIFSRNPPQLLSGPAGEPLDVFPFQYISYDVASQHPEATISEALDHFYRRRDKMSRIRQKSQSLSHILKNNLERCRKKLQLQEEALMGAARMDEYKLKGELLTANLSKFKRGDKEVTVENYYDDMKPLPIQLDIKQTPNQNAQRYYKLYQKARSAKETAREQKDKTVRELNFLEEAALDLENCEDESDLMEVRQELVKGGYVKEQSKKNTTRQLPQSKPYSFVSSDGISISVGKNSLQNDRLTISAKSDETWLHAKNMPGSHVIVHTEDDFPESTLKEAALLAAWYSKGQNSENVPVDFTKRRHIKKPGGAPAGFVIYTHQKTLYITARRSDIDAIKAKE